MEAKRIGLDSRHQFDIIVNSPLDLSHLHKDSQGGILFCNLQV
jgi:hypothetical protein